MDPSLQRNDDDVLKAIHVCNVDYVKKTILLPRVTIERGVKCITKKVWDQDIENVATKVIIERNYEPRQRVMSFVHSIARRMITWARYHEKAVEFTRHVSYLALKPSVFTPQGLIKSAEIAEELMTWEKLNIEQKFKLACMYSFVEYIKKFHREMPVESRKDFYSFRKLAPLRQVELIKFWCCSLAGDIDSLKRKQNTFYWRLEKSIESGNISAVEICLDKAAANKKKVSLLFAAIKAVEYMLLVTSSKDEPDLNATEIRRPSSSVCKPPPSGLLHTQSHYYIDILNLIFSKMSLEEQKDFLHKDISGHLYKKKMGKPGVSKVLECFLHWPYQANFMQTVEKMWEFLPKETYADVLAEMCKKLETKKGDTHYGEEWAYDYRKLIIEFLLKSPDRFKRYIFLEPANINMRVNNPGVKAGKLLHSIYSLENITALDKEIIKLMLISATEEQKRTIILSHEGTKICRQLVRTEKWQILDEFIQNMYQDEEEADDFKVVFCKSNNGIPLFVELLKEDRFDSAEAFIKWSGLSEDEERQLKTDIIFSDSGMMACTDLVRSRIGTAIADGICRWCLQTDENISNFKKRLIYSDARVVYCANLVIETKFDDIDYFIKWCLHDEVDILEFKKVLACRKSELILVNTFIEKFIFNFYIASCDELSFEKWEKIERIVTWCFSSEEEISNYKKEIKFDESIQEIHFHFIKEDKWPEAEHLFEWLEMTPADVQQIKKLTLYDYDPCFSFLIELASEIETKKDDLQKETEKDDLQKESEKDDLQKETVTEDLQKGSAIEDLQKGTAKEDLQKGSPKEDLQKGYPKEDLQKGYPKEDLQKGSPKEGLQKGSKEDLQKGTAKEDLQNETEKTAKLKEIEKDLKRKQDTLYHFLAWFLKDEETTRQFQTHLADFCQADDCNGVFETCNLVIEKYIADIETGTKGAKRKSDTFSPNKKICSSHDDKS